MPGMDINFGSSIFKREAKEMTAVTDQLKRNGWKKTGELSDSVEYYENSGINITVIDAPRGTAIIPSGPLRGRVFGDSGLMMNQTSVIGAGSDTGDTSEKQDKQAERRVQQIT